MPCLCAFASPLGPATAQLQPAAYAGRIDACPSALPVGLLFGWGGGPGVSITLPALQSKGRLFALLQLTLAFPELALSGMAGRLLSLCHTDSYLVGKQHTSVRASGTLSKIISRPGVAADIGSFLRSAAPMRAGPSRVSRVVLLPMPDGHGAQLAEHQIKGRVGPVVILL